MSGGGRLDPPKFHHRLDIVPLPASEPPQRGSSIGGKRDRSRNLGTLVR